jgi:hypothetical protein
MRPRYYPTITCQEVQAHAQDWLAIGLRLVTRGTKCTPNVVYQVLLCAAALAISVGMACRDLLRGVSDQAVYDALAAGLPKRVRDLENRLRDALCAYLPTRLLRHARVVAIDYHYVPYYGDPSDDQYVCRSKAKNGTTYFYVYATVAIVEKGLRYTLAFTAVKSGEATPAVVARLLAAVRKSGVRIRRLLLDRGFFSVAVLARLQQERVPFVVPVALRGRKPKRFHKATGLRAFQRCPAGWYRHTLSKGSVQVRLWIVVAYQSYRHKRTRKRCQRKLLYACWRVGGTPQEIRASYRKRFGIETSYRQMQEAQIRTSTRDAWRRVLYLGIALVLRNVWVWLHLMILAEQKAGELVLHLECLRWKVLLHRLAQAVEVWFAKTFPDPAERKRNQELATSQT